MKINPRAVVAMLAALPGSSLAHVGQHDGAGFGAGFLHPLMGLDHLLAMLCVGAISMCLLPLPRVRLKPAFLLPAAFLAAMLLGGLAGASGISLPAVESMIATSVLLGGLVLLAGRGLPTSAAIGVTALFAFFHGHAHGAEMPADSSALAFVSGFLLATALIHVAGIVFAVGCRRLPRGEWLLRLSGAGVLAAGASIAFI